MKNAYFSEHNFKQKLKVLVCPYKFKTSNFIYRFIIDKGNKNKTMENK